MGCDQHQSQLRSSKRQSQRFSTTKPRDRPNLNMRRNTKRRSSCQHMLVSCFFSGYVCLQWVICWEVANTTSLKTNIVTWPDRKATMQIETKRTNWAWPKKNGTYMNHMNKGKPSDHKCCHNKKQIIWDILRYSTTLRHVFIFPTQMCAKSSSASRFIS